MEAPDITAPVESVTVPWIEPAPLWAKAAVELKTRPSATAIARIGTFHSRKVRVRILANVFITIGSSWSVVFR
jgi:hypothetical protein